MGANDQIDIDAAGLDFIARWEGVVLKVYRDIAGLKTVGVGHLVTKAEDARYPDGMAITREHAMELLHADVQKCVDALRANITQPVNQNQANALISFAFNCGTGVLKNSGAAKAVNEGRFADVRAALCQWSKVRIKGVMQTNQGLLNRRKSEADLFEKPVESDAPASAPLFSQAEADQINALVTLTSVQSLSEYAVLGRSDAPDDGDAQPPDDQPAA